MTKWEESSKFQRKCLSWEVYYMYYENKFWMRNILLQITLWCMWSSSVILFQHQQRFNTYVFLGNTWHNKVTYDNLSQRSVLTHAIVYGLFWFRRVMDVLRAMLGIILLWSNNSLLFYAELNQRLNNLSYEKLKLIMLRFWFQSFIC